MITYAKLKHLDDTDFITLRTEVAAYHKKMNYFFDWSRQWEYPWILKNVPFKKTDIVFDAGGGTCHFPSIVAKRVNRVDVGDMYRGRIFKSDKTNISRIECNLLNFKSTIQYDIVTWSK